MLISKTHVSKKGKVLKYVYILRRHIQMSEEKGVSMGARDMEKEWTNKDNKDIYEKVKDWHYSTPPNYCFTVM